MKTRAHLIKEQYLVNYSEQSYQLRENYLCKTPSGAAQIVLGRSSNGWTEWANMDGKTLSDVYR
ncbi:DUF4357 domain-containing protein [uncultured Psychrobacter sp.]|uniref:DUF4357 domain-containing protein n=1 Tax=uncultured Psychrobacter sp. TaxID=259303 RepID=UPI003459C2A5